MQFLKQSGMQTVNGALFILKGVESEVVEVSSWAKEIMFESWMGCSPAGQISARLQDFSAPISKFIK